MDITIRQGNYNEVYRRYLRQERRSSVRFSGMAHKFTGWCAQINGTNRDLSIDPEETRRKAETYYFYQGLL